MTDKKESENSYDISNRYIREALSEVSRISTEIAEGHDRFDRERDEKRKRMAETRKAMVSFDDKYL